MAKKNTAKGPTSWGMFGAEMLFKNLLFVLFISFLGIVYIANAHFAESKVRCIQDLQKEVKLLRWEYMSLKSENMYDSKLSEVKKIANEQGLKLRKPKKIRSRIND